MTNDQNLYVKIDQLICDTKQALETAAHSRYEAINVLQKQDRPVFFNTGDGKSVDEHFSKLQENISSAQQWREYEKTADNTIMEGFGEMHVSPLTRLLLEKSTMDVRNVHPLLYNESSFNPSRK